MRGKNKGKRRYRSINTAFITTYIALVLIMVFSIGIPAFSDWKTSISRMTTDSVDKLNRESIERIDTFIQTPLDVNQTNYKMIQNGIVEISDENIRDRFFISVLGSYQDSIHSYTYATEAGEYYGAIRDTDGNMKIVRSDVGTSGRTDYYAVNKNMGEGSLLKNNSAEDYRTSAWYRAAVTQEGPVYSPVYNMAEPHELAISAVYPVYSGQKILDGVLEARIFLSDLSRYLTEIVKSYNGYGVIIEKQTGDLVASSGDADQLFHMQDGKMVRTTVNEIKNPAVEDAYRQYLSSGKTDLFSKRRGEQGRQYVNIQEYNRAGLSWVIISIIPESPQATEIQKNIRISVLTALLMSVFSIIIYLVTNYILFKPVTGLLNAAEKFTSGKLDERAPVIRNDEIGRIAEAFNEVTTAMERLVTTLNEEVTARTEELKESREQLLLILNSMAEAIFGTDLKGNCTFCNESCVKMLGYQKHEDLLGKDMREIVDHVLTGDPAESGSSEDEKKITVEEFKRTGKLGEKIFKKADGTSLNVVYHALPEFRNGEMIGAVVSFMDITEQKRSAEQIEYLSRHDGMTGLLNRTCFEQNMEQLDTEENLPLVIVYIDLNGLKLMNDTFGHAAGDLLIRKAGMLLRKSSRERDIAARVGGDEFCMLFPKTTQEEAKEIVQKIKEDFSREKIHSVTCSLSAGTAVKDQSYQHIEKIMQTAENEMYREKTASKKAFGIEAIRNIIQSLHERSPREKYHSETVSMLCEEIGKTLDLPETDLKKLREAGYMHDIGKITIPEETLLKESQFLTDFERDQLRQHVAAGYRILNLTEETMDLANGIFGHHEWWNGSGYPKGLKENEIPLASRIIAVAEAYDWVCRNRNYTGEQRKLALSEIRKGAGSQFDPRIAECFCKMILKS